MHAPSTMRLALFPVLLVLAAVALLPRPTVAEDEKGDPAALVPPPLFGRLKLKNDKTTPEDFHVRIWNSRYQGQEIAAQPYHDETHAVPAGGEVPLNFADATNPMHEGFAIIEVTASGTTLRAAAPALLDNQTNSWRFTGFWDNADPAGSPTTVTLNAAGTELTFTSLYKFDHDTPGPTQGHPYTIKSPCP